MKYIISGAAALLAVVAFSPAYALKVTNLDEVTHRVAICACSRVLRMAAAGSLSYFVLIAACAAASRAIGTR
jgi:uncharacterized protein (DUF1778 family)